MILQVSIQIDFTLLEYSLHPISGFVIYSTEVFIAAMVVYYPVLGALVWMIATDHDVGNR